MPDDQFSVGRHSAIHWPEHDTHIRDALERLSHRIQHGFDDVHHQLRSIMATQEELDAKVAQVTDILNTQFAQVTAEVQALKDQVAGGAQINLDSFAGLDAAVQGVSDAVPDDVTPTPEPTPPEGG